MIALLDSEMNFGARILLTLTDWQKRIPVKSFYKFVKTCLIEL